ncbi:hypothetical protein BH24ACT5_BH24ACT5_26900 [soil metagenome]
MTLDTAPSDARPVDAAPPVAAHDRDDASPATRNWRRWSGIALALVVVAAGVVAVNVHRSGHTQGDDFALYLRQAKSLFEGSMSRVIIDNRLLADNSTGVTPGMYPWGFPLLLSPFVRVWGLDFDRLKLIEVACLCTWLVLLHGIVRRRTGRIVALALTIAFASAPAYLLHTDQLLSEFPHLVAVAVVIWWLDRVMLRHRLTAAPTVDLAVLGLLAVVAYNVRRESLALVAVIGAAQLVDVAHARLDEHRPIRRLPWRVVAIPHVSFVIGVVVAQLLLPSTLVPDNGNHRRYIPERLFTDYSRKLTTHLGLDSHQGLGRALLAAAAVGAVVAVVRAPRFNAPLAALMVTTMTIIGTHFRMVDRYYFQVTPLVVYFVTMLVLEIVRFVIRHQDRVAWRQAAFIGAAVPLLYLTAVHTWSVKDKVADAHEFNDEGRVLSGPTNPKVADAFPAVLANTRPDDIIVYYRARTMTLYTDRRALQTNSFAKMAGLGDYFMQNLNSDYSQPTVTETQLLNAGFDLVWDDDNWRLWRIP